MTDESWTVRASCAGQVQQAPGDPDAMFVRGAAQRDARRVCFGCPVRMECLVEAFEDDIEYGVWGGLTERERRAMVRDAGRDPAFSWRERLEGDEDLRARFETERNQPPRGE